jgi:hypothetical protein
MSASKPTLRKRPQVAPDSIVIPVEPVAPVVATVVKRKRPQVAPKPEPEPENFTLKDLLSKRMQSLKVGDTISYSKPDGYMGDGGCYGMDTAYSLNYTIVKVGKDNLSFTVEHNECQEKVVVRLSNYSSNPLELNGYFDYQNDPMSERDIEKERRIHKILCDAKQKKDALALSKRAEKAAEKARTTPLEDKSKAELKRIILAYAEKKNVRVRNLTNATKETMIEYITKNNCWIVE